MVRRGPWKAVKHRDEWKGRLDNGRAFLETAENARDLADEKSNANPIISNAIDAVIGYADAITIKVGGIKNQQDHRALPTALRQVLGNRLPESVATGLVAILAEKDDSSYGHRRGRLRDADRILKTARLFAEWAETELGRA